VILKSLVLPSNGTVFKEEITMKNINTKEFKNSYSEEAMGKAMHSNVCRQSRKGSRSSALAALAAVMAFLTLTTATLSGCGAVDPSSSEPSANTQTSTENSTSASSDKNEGTSLDKKGENNGQSTTAAKDGSSEGSDKIGIDKETAIANVKELCGADSTIVSCTKGHSPVEGFDCWVVTVTPANSSETVTYYSGYQFCYSNKGIVEKPDSDVLEDSDGYIPESAAISNVKEQVGSGAKIVSSTKGKDPNGFTCWVIVVEPITNGTTPERVTYYSGYQFCYKAVDDQQSDGQNPMMNFIGNYTNGRAMMYVSCVGMDQASVKITWSGSVADSAVWTMSGDVSSTDDAVTLTYSNCTKEVLTYAEDGTVLSDTFEYQNGSGSIEFKASDNNAYWNDAQENASGGVSFWYYNE